MFSHYLMFNRNCANALEVYAKAFGAEIKELQKYGDMPNPGFPIADSDKNHILCIPQRHRFILCGQGFPGSAKGLNSGVINHRETLASLLIKYLSIINDLRNKCVFD